MFKNANYNPVLLRFNSKELERKKSSPNWDIEKLTSDPTHFSFLL